MCEVSWQIMRWASCKFKLHIQTRRRSEVLGEKQGTIYQSFHFQNHASTIVIVKPWWNWLCSLALQRISYNWQSTPQKHWHFAFFWYSMADTMNANYASYPAIPNCRFIPCKKETITFPCFGIVGLIVIDVYILCMYIHAASRVVQSFTLQDC